MNNKIKWFLIISGYFAVFFLTFLFIGGLDALIMVFHDLEKLATSVIAQFIEFISNL